MVGKKSWFTGATASTIPGIAGLVPYENMSRANILSRAIRAKNGIDVSKEFNPNPA